MAKRLCKMNRKQIAENLGDIHRLVVEPKFVCRSCARSSSDNASLCKPAAIPPQACQDKPISEQQKCGLLIEALPKPQQSPQKAEAVRRIVDRVKHKAQQDKSVVREDSIEATALELVDKKAIKKAKKAAKKQFKQQKKLIKLAKKQHKLMKKQRKLEASIEYSQKQLAVIPQESSACKGANLH
ncbi:hypothetical protein EJ063_17175 [Vibrio aquaticus]|uniref:Uncharacterized protein n=1 Tax=Vibrio aquaticus TaxID=2496559 RepID=A0A432CSP5_9VIBR|nr:hypothetical protein [Vibrio aquaticus]RTZ14181.1 hypothetical protein EJ063_17175 [Vibrio aquaticus]